MGCRSFTYNILFPSLLRVAKVKSILFYDLGPRLLQHCCNSSSLVNFQALRPYARDTRRGYDLFGRGRPGDEEFKKAWAKEMDEDNTLWTGSEDESDEEMGSKSNLDKEIKKARLEAKKHSDLIDANDSDELRSVWSGSDEEKTLWTGDEMDSDDDVPTEAYPNEKMLKAEQEPEELSPGKQARKIAVENAL
ncbi:unnamed protein product [Sphenostylis stenocarpa]|uniref:Uncharacterized protein n=1 Tax=Sphenostylis stenocarpa TaxID=92480 RepID=A0AA86T079_9FABA|nr:unnamed protein product [Sphenostylis stenocarpa]